MPALGRQFDVTHVPREVTDGITNTTPLTIIPQSGMGGGVMLVPHTSRTVAPAWPSYDVAWSEIAETPGSIARTTVNDIWPHARGLAIVAIWAVSKDTTTRVITVSHDA